GATSLTQNIRPQRREFSPCSGTAINELGLLRIGECLQLSIQSLTRIVGLRAEAKVLQNMAALFGSAAGNDERRANDQPHDVMNHECHGVPPRHACPVSPNAAVQPPRAAPVQRAASA